MDDYGSKDDHAIIFRHSVNGENVPVSLAWRSKKRKTKTDDVVSSPTELPTDSSTERPTESPPTVYSEYNEPEGLYFFHDDGKGGVCKIYEDGHSSNDENEPAEFYTESTGGYRRIYEDSYYTTDDGQRIYTDGHESNDDDPHALDYAVQSGNMPTRRVYKDGRESVDSDESNDDDPHAIL